MELAFEQKKLRDLCESHSRAALEFGEPVARKLKARLADLRSASSIRDVLVGSPRIVRGEKGAKMVLNLTKKIEIVFCANHNKLPMTDSGQVDWDQVSRIKILEICASHD